MSKFNKFNTLLETAFSHYSNGGFREGSPIRVKPEFLNSKYCRDHYGRDTEFFNFLKELIGNDVFFFIKRVVGAGAQQNTKDANDNEGTDPIFLVLKQDPRTVSVGTEMSEFTVPASFDFVEVLNFGVNLPPVQGVPNKYERPIGTKPEPAKFDYTLGNQHKDNSLPTKNTKI